MLLSPRVREGVHGVHVVTPLIRENGSTILVDRGFISREFVSSIDLNPYEGGVEVLGMLRTSQARNRFTPDNKPSEGLWYWTDVEEMAESAGGEQANVQPVFVEQIFGKSLIFHTLIYPHSAKRVTLERLELGLEKVFQLDVLPPLI
jgi:surfeit locus 1 family protein